jgi:hypothetical protein
MDEKQATAEEITSAEPNIEAPTSRKYDFRKYKVPLIAGGLVLVVALAFIVYKKATGESKMVGGASKTNPTMSMPTPTQQQYIANSKDTDSLDPVIKGKAMTYGQCDGTGSTALTHAPMDPKDIGTIAPEGSVGGAHVTPIDHQYYYGLNQKAAADTYPVYAVMNGNLNAVGFVTGQKTSWNITLSHSCTFMVYYNLMTSLAPAIKSQLPANWQQISGNVKISVKAGDIIGYSGGQSLDFQLANTEKVLPGLLHHTAYDNAEPIKINGVRPLDYFSAEVKTAILPKYLRAAEPRDGKYDYDVKGQAIGNWFLVGTNGYAGPAGASDEFSRSSGHLALAYDAFDPSALILSIGNYQGKPQEFVVKGAVDWTKITKDSGLAKIELAQGSLIEANGNVWGGEFVAGGLKYVAGENMATALLQMTDDEQMKVEIVSGKTPAQVTGFTAAAVMYDRGQGATMIASMSQSQHK